MDPEIDRVTRPSSAADSDSESGSHDAQKPLALYRIVRKAVTNDAEFVETREKWCSTLDTRPPHFQAALRAHNRYQRVWLATALWRSKAGCLKRYVNGL